MASRKRSDWSRSLPWPLLIPKVMTLRTLADVRTLLGHLPAGYRDRSTWRRVEALLKAAAADGAKSGDVLVALELVLMIERVEFRLKR